MIRLLVKGFASDDFVAVFVVGSNGLRAPIEAGRDVNPAIMRVEYDTRRHIKVREPSTGDDLLAVLVVYQDARTRTVILSERRMRESKGESRPGKRVTRSLCDLALSGLTASF